MAFYVESMCETQVSPWFIGKNESFRHNVFLLKRSEYLSMKRRLTPFITPILVGVALSLAVIASATPAWPPCATSHGCPAK